MAYKVQIRKRAIKSLQKIPQKYYQNIKAAIYSLAEDPRPKGCKKLKGREAYRLRIGQYRVIYEIIDNKLIVEVIDIGHRKDIYK